MKRNLMKRRDHGGLEKKLECEKLLNRMVKPNRIVQGEIYQGEVPNFRTSKDDFDSIRVSKKRRN